MNFEVGKTYGGYTIEARTACFVTIGGARKKISVNADGIEEISIDGTKIAAFEEIVAEQIIEPVVVIGTNDDENMIIVKDRWNQKWRLVAADTKNCLFEAVEHREIGYAPRTRTMPLKVVQALYGWDKKNDEEIYFETTIEEVTVAARSLGYFLELDDANGWKITRDDGMEKTGRLHQILLYLEAKRHSLRHDIHVPSALETQYSHSMGCTVTAVVRGIDQCGYEIAIPMNPSWFYDDNDRAVDLDLDRQRMQEMFDRDCDRAANFSMSTYRGTCGGMV